MTIVIPEAGPNIKSDQQPIHGREVEPQLIERARKLFEVDAPSYPSTFLGLAYLDTCMKFKNTSGSKVDETNELEAMGDTIARVHDILNVIDAVSDEGIDIIKDRFGADIIVDRLSRTIEESRRASDEAIRQRPNIDVDSSTGLDDLVNAIHQLKTTDMRFEYSIEATTLAHLLSGSRGVAMDIASAARFQNSQYMMDDLEKSDEPDDGFSELMEKSHRASNYLNESAARNPSAMRRDTLRQIQAIKSGQFDSLMIKNQPESTTSEFAITELPDIETDFEFLQGQELNFQILPGDTNLRTLSEEIFAESTDVEKVKVDLGRVQILEDIRQLFGKDKCYFARGIRSGVTYANDKNERIDEDFIVLVMQNHDSFGSVVSEDALAISPISRRHAAFYMRQDASAGLSWREVFSLTKKDAKSFGARKLKFVSTENLDPYDAMREKIFTLATGPAEDFEDELRYDVANKQYVLRKARIRANMATSAIDKITYDVTS